jgi:DNA-binding response OmpR family regulator
MKTSYIKLDDIVIATEIDFLIVEDERPIFEILEDCLEEIGFNGNCYHATSLSEAKKYLSQKKIDFIITDKGLPDGSGDSLVKAIRQSKKAFQNVPLLVLTGSASIEDQIISSKLGASAYLTKPFTIQELRDKLIDSFKSQALPTIDSNINLKNKVLQLEEEVLSLRSQINNSIETC